MEKKTIKVEGMSCEHCVKAIQTAVGAMDGVGSVTVDLASKSVDVKYDAQKVSLEAICAEIEDQGYDVQA